MSLEMAHKVIVPPKKNYIPQFLKQRDINSYSPVLECSGTADLEADASGISFYDSAQLCLWCIFFL
jgi:hypothetical protein